MNKLIENLIQEHINNFRYERKFVIDQLRIEEIHNIIKLHPANFSEIFYERQINNIYFDTFDKIFLEDNLIGTKDRIKVRLRWYGQTFDEAKKPNLELKIKKESLNIKEIFKMQNIVISRKMSNQKLLHYFRNSDLPQSINLILAKLKPTLLNTYNRRYFQSADKNFRLTIDHKISYYNLENNIEHINFDYNQKPHFIVELKYNKNMDDKARQILSKFPFRLSKNSKYVDGLYQITKHI